jgi:hypothetical protein
VKHLFADPDAARGLSYLLITRDTEAAALMGLCGIANGITLAGFKFMCIKAESDEVIGRKGVSSSSPSSFFSFIYPLHLFPTLPPPKLSQIPKLAFSPSPAVSISCSLGSEVKLIV